MTPEPSSSSQPEHDALDMLFLQSDGTTGSLLDELGLEDQWQATSGAEPTAKPIPPIVPLSPVTSQGAGGQPVTQSALGHALMAKLSSLEGSLPQGDTPALDKPADFNNNEQQIVPTSLSVQQSELGLPVGADQMPGGLMDDYSPYRDLSQASKPESQTMESGFGAPDYGASQATATLTPVQAQPPRSMFSSVATATPQQGPAVETDFSGNVQTLIRLVNELPEGVTKQTGAQIIRLTMEAMGISMEEVLSEAQSAQTDMLDAVRGNIRKIEELKAVIRKLESDNKLYQGKANDLSEIIDLFVLSSPSPSRVRSAVDELNSSNSFSASTYN